MRSTSMSCVIALAVGVGAAGCSTPGMYPASSSGGYSTQAGAYETRTGYVERIEVIDRGTGNNVAGTVIGGVIGGLIGTQIGGGSGRTAATIAGAAAGAAAGNVIEGRQRAPHEAFRVSVRLDDGSQRIIVLDHLSDLRTGDRVRVAGDSIVRI